MYPPICRPGDLPSEGGSYIPSADTGTRKILSTSSMSTSDKVDKLSARALPSPKSSVPPQLPQTVPGQVHANKPLLVVHKNNGPFVSSHDRRGSTTSTRSGSTRKSECANHWVQGPGVQLIDCSCTPASCHGLFIIMSCRPTDFHMGGTECLIIPLFTLQQKACGRCVPWLWCLINSSMLEPVS